jgi:NADPH-dependent glutamate synthase beta subunit-like oxidoreductase/NAD(P)H-flavin reductase
MTPFDPVRNRLQNEIATPGAKLNPSKGPLSLGIPGFAYQDLYDPEKLRLLSELFFEELSEKDSELSLLWAKYKSSQGKGMLDTEISDLLVRLSPYVSNFITKLFHVEEDRERLISIAQRDKIIFDFKREFLTRRALKKFKTAVDCQAVALLSELDTLATWLEKSKMQVFFTGVDAELGFSRMAMQLLALEKAMLEPSIADTEWMQAFALELHASPVSNLFENLPDALVPFAEIRRLIQLVEALSAARAYDKPLGKAVRDWSSYHLPQTLDFSHLVHVIRPDTTLPEKFLGPEDTYRRRDGFALTDERMTSREVQGETDYCIYCHERSKDSCSKGLHEKSGALKKNPLGIDLTGCPLDEKISEMHVMRNIGDSIAALALIMIDNPMCPGTGHRICNDCMKGCIYQKQTPVNIPQAETGALTDVLDMRWGFEIYGFLTRWNPLNVKRPYPLPYNGKKVLVVGLGPAGYTLSHYLLNEGFGVVGIDGLKIEPLPEPEIGSIGTDGAWHAPTPVEHWRSLYNSLDARSLDGFGGVAEYGITVRWDKNFLTTIYRTLARRSTFSIYGGVRFGGTITIEEAFSQYGFDHIAIASGAGKPTIVPMKNNLIRGIRKASDFLMALQLTGAQKRDTMANLDVELPAVVIGGGLTAIDTATELMAYYPVHVEKVFHRYSTIVHEKGEEATLARMTDEDKKKLATLLEHGKAIIDERARAERSGEKPNFIPLLRSWGGVSIAYRKSLLDSPAYRLNHEEVEKSLEEGIYYIENMSPVEAVPGEFGAVSAIIFERQAQVEGKWRTTGERVTLQAKTVCVAAGTSPNTIYEKEKPGTFTMDKWRDFFQSFSLEESGEAGVTELKEKNYSAGERGFFTSYEKDAKFITYYGDNHPIYAGNVVKAMASARDGYPNVNKAVFGEVTERPIVAHTEWAKFKQSMDARLLAHVVRVDRLTPTIVEIIVHAPAAADHFHPGQFYRLQNFEKRAKRIDNTLLMMEGLALTGAWVDKEKGLLSLIVLEMGSSSRLCAALTPGEQVIVMGPTGTPTEIPENETVLLAGGGLGNAVLFSIAKALKENNNRVIYFAGYKNGHDLFKREEIESATDQVIWSTDSGDDITPSRPQDTHIRANILQAMLAYEKGELGVPTNFPLGTVDRIIAIGSDRMMAAVKYARREGGMLAPYLKPTHIGIGSINSPMQCMMKEVCAQCLQKHVDPITQEEKGFVFSCFNQDQLLDEVDFQHLNDRLKANSLEEKLSSMWLDHLLQMEHVAMV